MERFLTSFVLSDQWGYRLARHIAFWAVCVLFFGTIYGSSFRTYVEAILYLPLHIFLSYAIIYYLFPKFLFKGKYLSLLGGIVILVFLTAVFSLLTSKYIIAPYRATLGGTGPYYGPLYGLLAGLRGSNTVAGFAAAIKLVKYWYFKKTENEKLEKEKLRAELEVLKGQLQPHFLFNTLNNLYSLVLQKSDEASQIVLRLSGLLHYMLAESAKNKISLAAELGIVKDYIALEQIRFGDRLDLTMNVDGDFEKKKIAPLILLPFVENAFKHGTHEILEQPWVSLDVAMKGNQLKFKLINGKCFSGETPISTGIGLQNVRKRLELLYPDKYELKTYNESESFVLSLQLELENE